MLKRFKYIMLSVFLFLSTITFSSVKTSGKSVISGFSTNGHTVYHLLPATVEGGKRAIVSATYDGFALCHSQEGELLWKNSLNGNFPFDLAVADIDGDDCDEIFVATGAGVLYVIDDNGKLLWTFNQTAPLLQVCPVILPDSSAVILTGGIGKKLYTLSSKGEEIHELQTKHVVRHIRSGNILGNGKEYVAVTTAKSGLSGTLTLMLIDPSTHSVMWEKTDLGQFVSNSGKRFLSMAIADLNNDSKEDIMLSNSWGDNGLVYAFDYEGEKIFSSKDKRIPNIPYRMNLLEPVSLPEDKFVIGLFGNVLIVYNNDGSCREVITSGYSFSKCAFDAKANLLWLGSSVSGGDGIYSIDLTNPNWMQEFKQIKPIGKLAKIEKNLELLKQQVANFKVPDYQPEPKQTEVIARKPEGAEYSHIHFMERLVLSQKYEKQDELWNKHIDGRRKYDKSAAEIIDIVKEIDSQNKRFSIWTGHGTAFHMPLSTLKQIVEASPNNFWGFEFAEMEHVDADMQNIVEKIMLPLAQVCHEHVKKIILRNKNIFWNGNCYVPFWKQTLLDNGLSDVFVPSVEETNCRTHELGLSGRLGLWLAGNFDQWSCRMVTDNANFGRMWEWGGQQVLSHHIRHLVSRASLGAEVFMNNIYQGPFTRDLNPQLTLFYDMVEKGIIQIPDRKSLLSVSPVAIGMKSPLSKEFIKHGTNGHSYSFPEDDQEMKVFDRLDCYWAGSQIQPYDFSSYGLGVSRRMSNFLPTSPYGSVAFIPDDYDISGTRFKQKISTDGQFYYDDGGHRIDAITYKPFVQKALQEGTKELPILVSGNLHWIASRLDEKHVRLTLIDPGYVNPSEQKVEVRLQHLKGTKCTDILSGENISINEDKFQLIVPAGVFRILDIEHD